jgi:hypothetical protein
LDDGYGNYRSQLNNSVLSLDRGSECIYRLEIGFLLVRRFHDAQVLAFLPEDVDLAIWPSVLTAAIFPGTL